MVLICNNTTMEVLLGFIAVTLVTIAAYSKWAFQYWIKRNVPIAIQPKILWGNAPNPLRNFENAGIFLKNIYDNVKRHGHKHTGAYLFLIPKYIPIDLEYITNILQRDFHHFTERGFYYNEKDDPLSANLFALGGERWRNLRTKLSPAFTSLKLKMMFDMIMQCGCQMKDEVEEKYLSGKECDIKDLASCYTIDVIGSCAFGLKCNSFKNHDAEFKKFGKRAFDFSSWFRIVKLAIAFVAPNFARWLGIQVFDNETIKFFTRIVKDTLTFRQNNQAVYNDLMQLLIELKNQLHGNDNNPETIKEITAQVFIFLAAGFETSATTLSYCLYELAVNPEIQDKVRDEIDQVLMKHDGKITYDAAMDMKYLSQVVDEALRKYPPLSFLTRVCVKDYNVPGTDAVIEEGTEVAISILGLHHDPEYYPDPEKFDPERFSDENKRTRRSYTYMPFGEGPKMCIGLRFGLMQTIVGLAILLNNYKFSLNKRTDLPLKADPYSFTLIPKSGIFLDVEKVNDC